MAPHHPVQEATLLDLLSTGACPALSRAYAAAAAAQGDAAAQPTYETALAALRSLPITTYSGQLAADCGALLQAMREGNDSQARELAAQLTGEPPLDWGMTSGTTGPSKHFPLTAESISRALLAAGKPGLTLLLAKFKLNATAASSSSSSPKPTRHRSLLLALSGPCEELPGGQLVGSISSVFLNKYSRLGVVDVDEAGADITTRPATLMFHMASRAGVSAAARYYALWLCAAADPGLAGVTMLGDLFAGNMMTGIAVLQHTWRDIVADLRSGQMSPRHADELPQAAVDVVNARLAAAGPDAAAASADHITHVMTEQQEAAAAGRTPPPLLSALMPHLHAVTLVITGSHAKFWPGLKALLAPHVPVCTPFYAGTEGIYAVTEQLVQPGPYDTTREPPTRQRFVLLPKGNCVFEFLEVAQGGGADAADAADDSQQQQEAIGSGIGISSDTMQQQQQRALMLEKLQVGRSYEFLVTTFGGLCRYVIGDIVRVEGFVAYDTQAACIVDDDLSSGGGDGSGDGSGGTSGPHVLRVPLVSFQGRVGVVLNLVSEKYEESQLLAALADTDHALRRHQAAAGGSAAPFSGLAEFTVSESHEDEANKHYDVFWELQQPAGGAAAASPSAQDVAAWTGVLNEQLSRHNSLYAGMSAGGQIAPAVVHLVQPGSFQALKDAAVAARRISPSQWKTPTVVAADSWYADFLRQRLL